MPICKIDGCSQPTEALGLCHRHYRQAADRRRWAEMPAARKRRRIRQMSEARRKRRAAEEKSEEGS